VTTEMVTARLRPRVTRPPDMYVFWHFWRTRLAASLDLTSMYCCQFTSLGFEFTM
jgi:hypothetical protein